MGLSHLDAAGRARMVDVGDKPVTLRTATANGVVRMSQHAFELVRDSELGKGDVAATAELAGVMAGKRTSELVPLCHQVPLDRIEVVLQERPELPGVEVTATVRATARTGVEMEALVATSIACCTVYDMVKSVDRGATIESVRVIHKTGGTRGDWSANRHDTGVEEQ